MNPEIVLATGAARCQDSVASRSQARSGDPSLLPANRANDRTVAIDPDQSFRIHGRVVGVDQGTVGRYRWCAPVRGGNECFATQFQGVRRKPDSPDGSAHLGWLVEQVPARCVARRMALDQAHGLADAVTVHPPRHNDTPLGGALGIEEDLAPIGRRHKRRAGRDGATPRAIREQLSRNTSQGRDAHGRADGRHVGDRLAVGRPSRARQCQSGFLDEQRDRTPAQRDFADSRAGHEPDGITVRGPEHLPRTGHAFDLDRVVPVEGLQPDGPARTGGRERDVAAVGRYCRRAHALLAQQAAGRAQCESTQLRPLVGCARRQ